MMLMHHLLPFPWSSPSHSPALARGGDRNRADPHRDDDRAAVAEFASLAPRSPRAHRRRRRFLVLRLTPVESAEAPSRDAEPPRWKWRTVYAGDLQSRVVRRLQVLSPTGPAVDGPTNDGPDGDGDPPPSAPAACQPVGHMPPAQVAVRRAA